MGLLLLHRFSKLYTLSTCFKLRPGSGQDRERAKVGPKNSQFQTAKNLLWPVFLVGLKKRALFASWLIRLFDSLDKPDKQMKRVGRPIFV